MQDILAVAIGSAVDDKSTPVGYADIPTYSPCMFPALNWLIHVGSIM